MPLSLQTSIKSQLSQGKWEKVAKWLYWTLIEAVVGCLSRALSFHFLSSGLKLIGMNFFKTREQTHQRACRISSGFLSVELLMSHWIWTTKPHRNRKTNIALIIHTLSNGTSSMKTSPPAESAFVNLSFGLPYGNNYSLYYIVVIVFSLSLIQPSSYWFCIPVELWMLQVHFLINPYNFTQLNYPWQRNYCYYSHFPEKERFTSFSRSHRQNLT